MANTIITQPATPGPTDPAGFYGTLLDVQNAGGKKNVLTYSNLDGKKDAPDYGRLQVVMNQVDDRITTMLAKRGIARPEAGSTGFSLLTDGWALMVLAKTYRARGDLDVENDKQGRTAAQGWHDEGLDLIADYVAAEAGRTLPSRFMFDRK